MNQAVLSPAGPVADLTGRLFAVFLIAGTVVVALVLVVLVAGVIRGRLRARRAAVIVPEVHPDAGREQRLVVSVTGAAFVTVVVLFTLLILDFATARRLRASLADPDPLTITVTGHQWWWEVTYSDTTPSLAVTTANELHLPMGRVVKLQLQSTDVIHSFWAPNLAGKKDLVPGHPAVLYLRADRPGTYTGQCAEFCGAQHAHMRFTIVVEPPMSFATWLDAQRAPAKDPSTALASEGRDVFLRSPCVLCHTIQGTSARATIGPDLTHLASRSTLAAGSVPNTAGWLAGWITNPGGIKPGVLMPPTPLAPRELRALVAYLGTLQ